MMARRSSIDPPGTVIKSDLAPRSAPVEKDRMLEGKQGQIIIKELKRSIKNNVYITSCPRYRAFM